jgi:hypothetical protein
MRYLKDIPNNQYKISLFQWNGKYIVKFEAGGHFEQTYKLDETEILAVEDIDLILDEEFLKSVTQRFALMSRDIRESCERNQID